MKDLVMDLMDNVKSALKPLDIRNHSEKTRAFIALGMVSFFWGTTWLASKIGVRYIPAIQLSGMRHFLGGGIFITYFLFKGYKLPDLKLLLRFTWMSVLMFVVSNGLTVWSVQYLPSGLGAVLGAIAPLWIALFSLLLFKDTKLNLVAVIGLVLGIGGIAIIFSDHLREMADPKFTLGIAMGMTGTMAWALGTLFTVRHAKDIDPYYSLGWQMFLSGLILNVLSLVTGMHVPFAEVDHRAWLSIAYLVVVGSIITFTAFIYTLKRLPAAQASIYAYVNPIVAVVIGALLNHEPLTLAIAAGTAVTLMGVYLVNTGFKKSKEG
jgi:drug/metabolite transporter (DMT)-like permease